MLAKTRELTEKVLKWYEDFEFNRIFHAINEFCNADLSALYLDVLKDRMYTFAPTSKERLSAQTALYRITDALVRLVAPILSFTADEVWGYMPKVEGGPGSVHLTEFPTADQMAPSHSNSRFESLLNLRPLVLASLEADRKTKQIGKGLEAKAHIVVATEIAGYEIPHFRGLLIKYGEYLPELFNVSSVSWSEAKIDDLSIDEHQQFESGNISNDLWGRIFTVTTSRAEGRKCERCLRYTLDVGPYGPWPAVCGRCADALNAMGYAELAASVTQ